MKKLLIIIGVLLMTSLSHRSNAASLEVAEKPIRKSARLIIINNESRVLLMQIALDKPADAKKPIREPYWVTLGGGVNKDETLEDAAQRELKEETGITTPIGPKIWHGVWESASRINDETYFMVRVSGTDLDLSGLEEDERKVIKQMKWWHIDDIISSKEIFIPIGIGSLLKDLILKGLPAAPIEIDLSTPDAS